MPSKAIYNDSIESESDRSNAIGTQNGKIIRVLLVTKTHEMSSVTKLTIVLIKFSRTMRERICFQSVALSPSSRQMDSSASLTAAGGVGIDLTSTRCCFLIDLTAVEKHDTHPTTKNTRWQHRVSAHYTGEVTAQHAELNTRPQQINKENKKNERRRD